MNCIDCNSDNISFYKQDLLVNYTICNNCEVIIGRVNGRRAALFSKTYYIDIYNNKYEVKIIHALSSKTMVYNNNKLSFIVYKVINNRNEAITLLKTQLYL